VVPSGAAARHQPGRGGIVVAYELGIGGTQKGRQGVAYHLPSPRDETRKPASLNKVAGLQIVEAPGVEPGPGGLRKVA
jgi:hypothetical protein